jgi:hypothetical protein
MALPVVHATFERELVEQVRVFEELAMTKTFTSSNDFTTDDLCLLEGILSRIWQAWCHFCRQTLIESCLGTQDLSGLVPPLPVAQSEPHVSSAAIAAKLKRPVTWQQQNTILRKEPTWGDIDVLLDIIQGLAPTNATKLRGMCTIAGAIAKVLQAARNASAHHNQQTLNDLLRLSTPYNTFPTNHACQSLFWKETTTGDYLLPQALQELKDAADHAVL